MARAWFGRGSEDFFVAGPLAPGDSYRTPPQAIEVTFWDAETGGTQYTDLLLDGTTPVDSITVPTTGQPPAFQGPDGVVAMWAQAGNSTTRRMMDAGADIATQVAADREAVAADRAAVEAVGTTNDTVIASRINDPESATAAALLASTADIMADVDLDEVSAFRQQQEARWAVRGETLRLADFSGATARERLQQVIDFYVAIGYDKSVVLDAVYDLTGGGTPHQTVFLYGDGGAGLTSFTLTFAGQTTASISATASAATVQAELEALSNIAPGEVTVTRSGTGGTNFDDLANPPYAYMVSFQGTLKNTTTVLTATPTGGTGTVRVKAAAISLAKVNWHDRDELVFLGVAGGGIRKDDAGSVFTTDVPNTGDITFDGVKLFSISGAGTTLVDGDKLIRVSIKGCLFRNWDFGVTQLVPWRWLQSFVMDRATKVIGGAGAFVYCYQSYDVTATGMIEDRAGGLFANTTALTVVANRVLRFARPIIENCSGIPIQLAPSGVVDFDGIYFEQNGGATDPQIDLWTLAQGGRQVGVIIHNCMTQQTAAQKTNKVGAVLVGNNGIGGDEWVTSIENWMDGGIMYQFGSATGVVYGSGDKVENSGTVARVGQENQYISAVRRSVSTGNRPKNPRVGVTQVFDTTLGKVVTPTAAGVAAQFTLRFTSGATSSGNITISMLGVNYTVAVTAGDSLTQVRDKVVAAAATFYPTWKPRASSTDVVAFEALTPGGPIATTSSFDGGTTGVTNNYFGRDVAGTDPTWGVPANLLTATATLDFPSIAAGGSQELTITVTGAATGETVALGAPAAIESGLVWNGYVSAANTVKVRVTNVTGGAIDPAPATWRATIVR